MSVKELGERSVLRRGVVTVPLRAERSAAGLVEEWAHL